MQAAGTLAPASDAFTCVSAEARLVLPVFTSCEMPPQAAAAALAFVFVSLLTPVDWIALIAAQHLSMPCPPPVATAPLVAGSGVGAVVGAVEGAAAAELAAEPDSAGAADAAAVALADGAALAVASAEASVFFSGSFNGSSDSSLFFLHPVTSEAATSTPTTHPQAPTDRPTLQAISLSFSWFHRRGRKPTRMVAPKVARSPLRAVGAEGPEGAPLSRSAWPEKRRRGSAVRHRRVEAGSARTVGASPPPAFAQEQPMLLPQFRHL